MHVRLRLEHQHVLYGDYDPLLGVQDVELTLGSATLRDRVPLDREHYLAQPKYVWPEPPEDRRDTRHLSRRRTACTSRPTSPDTSITATPNAPSATAARCGCGSGT